MKSAAGLIALCLVALSQSVLGDVVVFVHGLAGFGPEELLGIGYWGLPGVPLFGQDFLAQVRSGGHTVLEASVGPVSSNWDRACELYAQIKGLRVDYGKVHSAQYHQAGDAGRYGKDYTNKGLYPSWSAKNKIHLVGHSMGGNTIRMLEYLLHKGDAAEEQGTSSRDLSELFVTSKRGGGSWIESVTTISTPHDGSTLHTKLGNGFVEFIKDFIAFFVQMTGYVANSPDFLYNFDLEQFGLQRNSGESFSSYQSRVEASHVWSTNFKDIAAYDLSPEACEDFNKKTQLTYPDTYYFSISTYQTHPCGWLWGDDCPDLDMEAMLAPFAALIGNLDGMKDSRGYAFGNNDEPNDGMVPLSSSRSPKRGVANYRSPRSWGSNFGFVKGLWYNKDVERDHVQIIGTRLNLLELDSSAGIYWDIRDVINSIRMDGKSYVIDQPRTTDETTMLTAGQGAAIGIGSAVGAAALFTLGAAMNRRRKSVRRESELSSSNANRHAQVKISQLESPRSESKRWMLSSPRFHKGGESSLAESPESPSSLVSPQDSHSGNPVYATPTHIDV